MSDRDLRIGTRRSALALAQARLVADALSDAGIGSELVEIVTAGDRGAPGGDKSRWVAEIDRALLAGEVDLAVHSAKDVPGDLAEGVAIAAVPPRADARDAICGADSPELLPRGARVATSSLRRAAQLRALREDLEVVPIRGNVDTRLRKLADGECDALVLAVAGLERLGRAAEGAAIDAEAMTPAPGQGALAVAARAGDETVEAAARALDDRGGAATLAAERALSAALEATCRTPLGAHAVPDGDGSLVLHGFVGLPDGTAWARDRVAGSAEDPEALGREVGERLLAAGAGDILRAAEG